MAYNNELARFNAESKGKAKFSTCVVKIKTILRPQGCIFRMGLHLTAFLARLESAYAHQRWQHQVRTFYI